MNKSTDFQHKDVNTLFNIDLGKYSTFRLSSIGSIAIVKSVEGLMALGEYLKCNNIDFAFVGLGANQILNKNDDKFIYIKVQLDSRLYELNEFKLEYELSSSITLNQLTKAALKFGLKGWEVFTGIPATLGGAIVMNAGTGLGEISELLVSVTILRNLKELVVIKFDANSFKYRGNNFIQRNDVIISAVVKHFGASEEIGDKINKYLQYRRDSQPLDTKNCGCVFKNNNKVVRAGLTLDLIGLKGLNNGKIRISNKHANFFENYNYGKYLDFIDLKNMTNNYLDRFIGIKFELEVKID